MTEYRFDKEDYVRQKPIDLMINTVTIPDGLDEKILAAMTERRKENEKKAKQKQEKQEKRKNTFIRAALIAAIITLIIVATPMRGYVASAATDAWNAFHSWMDDVFHVGMKQTKNGCTVEIIEARVANDFLYLTVEDNLDDYFVDMTGSIDDNKGDSIPFSVTNTVASIYSNYPNQKIYTIIIPDLGKLISSYNNQYICDLTIEVYPKSTTKIKKNITATFHAKFNIKKIDSAINVTEMYSSDVITVDNIDFKSWKLVKTASDIYMLAEYNTSDSSTTYDIENVDVGLRVIGLNKHQPYVMESGITFDLVYGHSSHSNGKSYVVMYLCEPYFYDERYDEFLNLKNITIPKMYQITECNIIDIVGCNPTHRIQYSDELQTYVYYDDEGQLVVSPYAENLNKVIIFD